jgi:hypothetical protein
MSRLLNAFYLKVQIQMNQTGRGLEMHPCYMLQLLEVFMLSGALVGVM